MGDPKKPRKCYDTPKKPWDKERIKQEAILMNKYGLKNKRELWRAQTIIRNIRHQARSLLALPEEIREKQFKLLVNRVKRMGLIDKDDINIDDILSLTVENLLDRRLQTIVYKKGFAKTIKHARQLIVHGHICIGERRVTKPGYLVDKDEEDLIRLCED